MANPKTCEPEDKSIEPSQTEEQREKKNLKKEIDYLRTMRQLKKVQDMCKENTKEEEKKQKKYFKDG